MMKSKVRKPRRKAGSSPHTEFMAKALRLAAKHSRRGNCGPFGAVIVRQGRVVGEGWNQVVSSGDPTAHAEVVAIRDACRKLRTHILQDCEIYTSCEPCPMCLAAVYWARLDAVYFACRSADAAAIGFDDSAIYRQISLPKRRRSLVMKETGRAEGLVVLKNWFSNPKRKPY